MCGRYTLSQPAEVVAELVGSDLGQELTPRYNIAPTQEAAIARAAESGRRTISLARWGLIPSWAKDPKIGNRMINARSESVADKPAYRNAFRRRRCLVPADGFYEWQRTGGAKRPWLFRPAGEPLFALAGLWERWSDGPVTVETFTILTTRPNELVAPIHDRMPVILDRGDFSRWLEPGSGERSALEELLAPFPADRMRAHTVSTLVNDPTHDDPRCVEPLPAAPGPGPAASEDPPASR